MSIIKRIVNTYNQLSAISSRTGKSRLLLITDFLKLRKQNQVSLIEYCNFKLYQQDNGFRNDFLSYSRAMHYWEILNPTRNANLARDKFISHCLLHSVGIPTAKLIAYYNPETASTSDLIANSYESLSCLIKKSGLKTFVIKPSKDSAHGHGVIVCRELMYKGNELLIVKSKGEVIPLRDILGNESLLFEEKIEQTTQAKSFNSSSLNTVRIMTALYPDKSVKIIAAFLKIGREGSDIDNAGQGGNVDCGVNVNNGILYNTIQFNSWQDITSIAKHPDTGTQLEGAKLEHWDYIKQKLCYYQGLIPQLKVIGWDVAITDKGPIIIEINNWWDTTGQAFIAFGWKPKVEDCYNAWKTFYHNR